MNEHEDLSDRFEEAEEAALAARRRELDELLAAYGPEVRAAAPGNGGARAPEPNPHRRGTFAWREHELRALAERPD